MNLAGTWVNVLLYYCPVCQADRDAAIIEADLGNQINDNILICFVDCGKHGVNLISECCHMFIITHSGVDSDTLSPKPLGGSSAESTGGLDNGHSKLVAFQKTLLLPI